MSMAGGGPNWYENDEYYQKDFSHFEEKYKAGSLWNLYYNPMWKNRGAHWGYLVSLFEWVRNAEIMQPYLDLIALLQGKNFEIVTTNQDTQFVKAFPEKNVAIIQGSWDYMQCSELCHDKVYDSSEILEGLYEKIDGVILPEELIPNCPKCGAEMEGWIRGSTFLEGSFYQQQYAMYQQYANKAKGKNTVFLELGVGMMTPMFIKEPFMNLTYQNPNSTYITINPNHAIVPPEIDKQSIGIQGDIAQVLKDALSLKAKRYE
ncbi:NAD-dependent protein deacetylase [Macrococcus animalis]|uniref:NAD-dependent protein deacetylase n=1 Tax=Macrococcus animalis TaxID=3395467 RepID=UPI0039BE19F5